MRGAERLCLPRADAIDLLPDGQVLGASLALDPSTLALPARCLSGLLPGLPLTQRPTDRDSRVRTPQCPNLKVKPPFLLQEEAKAKLDAAVARMTAARHELMQAEQGLVMLMGETMGHSTQ